jgi:hypothetical protein
LILQFRLKRDRVTPTTSFAQIKRPRFGTNAFRQGSREDNCGKSERR